jgi:hypothetical protein
VEPQAALVETAARLQEAMAVLPEPVERKAAGMRQQALRYQEELAGLTRYSPQVAVLEAQGVRTLVEMVAQAPPVDLVAAAVVQGTMAVAVANHLTPPIIRVREGAADLLTQLALLQVLLPGVVRTLETTAIPIMQILQGKEAMEEVPELTAYLELRAAWSFPMPQLPPTQLPLSADPMGASPHPVWSACRPATVKPSLLAPVQTAESFKS